MTNVSLMKCDSYDLKQLKDKIIKGFNHIGFDINGVRNQKVALKPNLLIPSKIERAIVTHPSFFRAICEIIDDHQGRMIVIESPAYHGLEPTLKKVGYLDTIQSLDIQIADVHNKKTMHYSAAKTYKNIDIAQDFFDADIIVNMPKFKTHGFTYVTGALKNYFGSIPGLKKSQMHMTAPSYPEFATFLLDLYGGFIQSFEPPKQFINIMDGIIVQEGEGPGPAGTPRPMNVIIIGTDAVAVDCVAVRVSGLDIEKVLTIQYAFERPFSINSENEISVLGDRIEDVSLKDFKSSKNSIISNAVRWPLTSKTVKNLLVEKPVPNQNTCSACYQCHKICPAGAISKPSGKSKVPVFNYNQCIRCFCCMEVCPEAAIQTQKGTFQWILELFQ